MTPSPQTETGRCETCRFWGREREHDDNRPYGSCRRQSPSMPHSQCRTDLNDGDQDPFAKPVYVPRRLWPWTAFDDWCGEYVTREEG